MEFSEQWLREWVKTSDSLETIAANLTLAGLESKGIIPDERDRRLMIDFTPNRGDCLSIRGLSREISVISEGQYQPLDVPAFSATSQVTRVVQVLATAACPHYVGCRIDNIRPNAKTPQWIAARLQQHGLKLIHPVVDCLNYVMLELGQPMHAFDNACLSGDITVRFAKVGETIALLDGNTITLDPEALVIADANGPVALAGIMGGGNSAVSEHTTSLFLESAHFSPAVISVKARQWNIQSDAAYRYERGVDPQLPALAMARAVQLITECCGGEVGPLVKQEIERPLRVVMLRRHAIEALLGMEVTDDRTVHLLERLGCQLLKQSDGWKVTIPSWRSDLQIEADLIEEIGRLVGYHQLPRCHLPSIPNITSVKEQHISRKRIRSLLLDRGYSEVITYSFVSPKIEKLLHPEREPLTITNPISSDMSVMRTTLLSGLLSTAQYHCHRQQQDLAFFEIGLRFVPSDTLQQIPTVAGLLLGRRFPLNWADSKASVDFYDIKGDVESLLSLGDKQVIQFVPTEQSSLHPYQSAMILANEKPIGIVGAIHPQIVKQLDLPGPVYVFELALDKLPESSLPRYRSVGRFPIIRRDLAVLVGEQVPVARLVDTIQGEAGPLLMACQVFDVYQGRHLPEGKKSVAFALTLGDNQKTLVDAEVNACIERIVDRLYRDHQALIREGA